MGKIAALTAILVLLTTSYVPADDWPGFHGLERQGRCDSMNGPLHWSPSSNVAWKTVIPGRGHSSPILSGDSIYLTTAYERSRTSPGQMILSYTVWGLALLFTLTGIVAAGQSLTAATGNKG